MKITDAKQQATTHHDWRFLKNKADNNSVEFTVYECSACGLLRRQTTQNAWNYTRTLYHRRGRTHANGEAYWFRYLKEENETNCKGAL
jgi:hypothetical protein